MWAAQFYRFEEPRRWINSGGLGTMGVGLPYAMGIKLAKPDADVFCITGEGSIQMCIQELSTCLQYNTPVKVVSLNNRYLGMVRQWQQLNHGNRLSHSWNEAMPDFVALARAFGWGARRVDHAADLARALAECLASPGPFFLDVRVVQQANCYPMIPAGCGHQEMMLGDDRWYTPEQAAVIA